MILPLITSLYALASIGTAYFLGAPWGEIAATSLFSAMVCIQLLIFYAVVQLGIGLYNARSLHPSTIIRAIDCRFSDCNKDKSLTSGIKAMAILYPLFLGFTVFKSLIPLIHPYSLDPLFAEWDLMLHGDEYPHRLLGSLAQSNITIRFAEYIYYLWFFVVLAANGFAIFFDKNHGRRKCYLWASVLSWGLVGSLGATLLSSVGPIFYGDFYDGANPYADIRDTYTIAVQNGATLWQEAVTLLLDISRNSVICDLNGISAMPSMHVGISFLITLYAFSISRKAGMAALAFTILIFISSLILGFHYAIDGYVSCAAMWIIWIICRYISHLPFLISSRQ